MKIVISSYGKENETIGLYEINNGQAKRLDYDSIINPSYVVNGDGYIYTYEVNEGIYLQSYKVGDSLEKHNRKAIPGNGITHLSYSPKNKLLLGCSYGDGTYFSIGISEGRFGDLYTYEKQINDDRLSRCHAIIPNHQESEVAVVNIALDATFIYRIEEGKLMYKEMLDYPKGSGPRHAIYSDDDRFLYTVTEYSNEIIIHDLNKKTIVQTISTIPNYHDKTFGATLVFSKNRQYLYATNRGEDTIAKFKVGRSLEYIDSYSCGGKHPRHMAITKDGKYLINCNKDSNNVSFFDIEKESVVLSISFFQPTGIVEV